MTDARRDRYVSLLLAVGVLMVLGGVVGGLAAKASADHPWSMGSSMPTLPIFVYTQYTQATHPIVPDYTGLWIGIGVAVLGAIILAAGVIVASTKPPTA
ncbi:hypothetical protein ACPPVQ_07450 [Diaminobutyricibacter sp. McL0618]|uniref:hypothetical protein n=1 Tax=Leifsonia sp. McL0618 TaxID=3415677 RepID=UPI003CEF39C4